MTNVNKCNDGKITIPLYTVVDGQIYDLGRMAGRKATLTPSSLWVPTYHLLFSGASKKVTLLRLTLGATALGKILR